MYTVECRVFLDISPLSVVALDSKEAGVLISQAMTQLQGETRPWGHRWRSSELFIITATAAALLTGTDSVCHDN